MIRVKFAMKDALAFAVAVGLLSTIGWASEPQQTGTQKSGTQKSGTQQAAPAQQAADTEATDDSAPDRDDKTMSVWMEKKLMHSQAILRGLAMGDFADVKYNAGRLKVLNRVEGFVRRKNPDYRAHLHTFSRVSAEIERQAENENIEGATLAFNQLTVSCVECHKSLRSDDSLQTEVDPKE